MEKKEQEKKYIKNNTESIHIRLFHDFRSLKDDWNKMEGKNQDKLFNLIEIYKNNKTESK